MYGKQIIRKVRHELLSVLPADIKTKKLKNAVFSI